MPHEEQAPIAEGGYDASAGIIGMPLATELLCPGGNFEMAMQNIVGSRENRCLMNLFAWMIDVSHAAGLTCFMETVVDAEAMEAISWPVVLRCRLFIPVPLSHAEVLLDRMRESLNATAAFGDAPEGDSGLDVHPGRASPAVGGHLGQRGNSGGWSAASRMPLSSANIDSLAAFLAALQVAIGRPRDDPQNASTVDFSIPGGLGTVSATSRSNLLFGDDPDDMDGSAAIDAVLGEDDDYAGDVDHTLFEGTTSFSARSPLTLLSADNMFSDELIDWDRKQGAHSDQLDQRRYIREGRLMFPAMARAARGQFPPLVMVIRPNLGGRIGPADEILSFNWPMSQAPVAMLISQCRATMKYICAKVPRGLDEAKTVGNVRTVLDQMSRVHPRGLMCRPEMIDAPDFPHRSEAPALFRHPFEKIWPIQAATIQRTHALLQAATEGYQGGLLDGVKLKQIFCRQLASSLLMMLTPTAGVDPTFSLLAQDLSEVQDFVETGLNKAAKTSKTIFLNMQTHSPATKKYPEPREMPLLSQILAQKTALVRGYLNISAAQVEAFIPIEASGHGMGGDDFGQLCQTWLLKGPFDAGKSKVLEILGTCVPDSMWHQTMHKTAGSKTLPEPRGFHMADEQKTNTTSGGKSKGNASSSSDLDQLSMKQSGCLFVERLVFDPRAETPSRLEKVALDKRQICVAAGNGMYDEPYESRCTVKLMGKNEESSKDYPDRRELTLSASIDAPGREAVSSYLQYCMALSNRMWVPYAAGCVLRFDTTMCEIFYGLTTKFLVPAGYAIMDCRPLAMMKRQARSYAVMRLSTQWERLSKLSLKQRDAGRDLFFLANSVVQAQDVLQAYFDIAGTTDCSGKMSEILSTLKTRITYESAYGNVPKDAPSNSNHYLTDICGVEGLADACPNLGESIIQSVLPKLQFSDGTGGAKVGIERERDFRNHMTISKSAADSAACLTKPQQLVINYLVDTILSPPGTGARQWYPEVKANGEETGNIVFRSSVLQTIKGGAAISSQSQTTRAFRSCSQDLRRTALDMFEKANLMSFRAEGGGDSDRSATVANPIASLPGVTRRASKAGLLDPVTALEASSGYQQFFSDTPDDEPSSEQLQEWLAEVPVDDDSLPKRVPRGRPNISVLDLHGVLVIRSELAQVICAVQQAKCAACNVQAPPGSNYHETMEEALQKMIDVLFSISGEAEPGQDIFCGASLSAEGGISWRRIRPFTGTVTIWNSRRRQVENTSLMPGMEALEEELTNDSQMSNLILPPSRAKVTFSAGDNITARLLRETRRINVPFANPDDPQIPDAASSPEPIIQAHAVAAEGQIGGNEHLVTTTGSVSRRLVRDMDDDEEEDMFNF